MSRESDSIYGFQKIIGKRKNGRTYEYQVVWSGCDEDTATWEPEDNLQNAKAMISNFERSKSPTQNIFETTLNERFFRTQLVDPKLHR